MSITRSRLVHFDLVTGKVPDEATPSLKRHLSSMKGMYADGDAFDSLLRGTNPLVYEFYDMGNPETPQEIAFGTSIVYPGKVGDEYFMTKGHFHTILETAEVYYCLQGHGLMLMESPEGDVQVQELTPGEAVYVPGRYAHRSVNVGTDGPLVTFFSFRADAGHDYGTIETRGFRKLAVEHDGKWALVDNPRWTQE